MIWRSLLALGLSLVSVQPQSTAPPREVAITFDDLPFVSVVSQDIDTVERLTGDLLRSLARHQIPAIGFVNENKLQPGGEVDPRRVALLRQWTAAGLELGNHGFSHLDLHTTPVETVQRDVVRGEVATRALLAESGKQPRYFRHPFLHTGRSLDVRRQFDAFLTRHGYRVAPVTFDNYDYVFAAAFARARDEPTRVKIAAAYVEYMTSVVAYYEQQSTALLGREVRQILLLHANALNAHTMNQLAAMLQTRGYRFVSLDRALDDAAYASTDTFVGPGGITWLHRWALTQGKGGAVFAGEPAVPAWIEDAARPR